jgi:hypothetical protein
MTIMKCIVCGKKVSKDSTRFENGINDSSRKPYCPECAPPNAVDLGYLEREQASYTAPIPNEEKS